MSKKKSLSQELRRILKMIDLIRQINDSKHDLETMLKESKIKHSVNDLDVVRNELFKKYFDALPAQRSLVNLKFKFKFKK